MNIVEKANKFLHRKDLDWNIRNGYAPHGRTAPIDSDGVAAPMHLDLAGGAGTMPFETQMTARHIRNGQEIDRRVVHNKVVTTAFANYLVDSLQSTEANWINFKYHDAGTGIGDEAAGDTTLGTPWGGARATGTQIEGASANIYKSVATITFNNTFAITEHGLFNASSSGTLMDRSKFTAINVINGDSIEFTYQLTITAGN